MAYIGNQLATQFQAFVTQTITGDGSTGYTLDRAVANGKELLVYINNVKQEEGSGKAYTASGTTITFSDAVASTDSCYVVFLGSAVQTVVPSDGSLASYTGNASISGTLGVTGAVTANAGVTIDEITIDADTITATDDFFIDATADIILDAGGADIVLRDDGTTFGRLINSSTDFVIKSETSDKDIIFQGNDGGSIIEAMRIDMSGAGIVYVGKTADDNTVAGITLHPIGIAVFTRDSASCAIFNRESDDGQIISLRQDNAEEGSISVSGGTVTYGGFSGLHESSGIATDTPIGTVVSTIDELDVYASKQEGTGGTEEDNPKAGQTRVDHAKVKVSDTVGDSTVYGVVGNFNAQGKVNVVSVGVGSVRVTGACAKGDLLESNGDGTAKVQSDDIVRSKTIGKVTIGNSNSGVKSVSCVLYCG